MAGDMFVSKFKSPPVIYQNEISECGLACICMVGGWFGQETSLRDLREKHPISQYGASLYQLTEILAELRVNAQPIEFDIEQLAALPTPTILHFGGNHFVVLFRVRGNQALIVDPALGRRLMPVATLKSYLSGYAVLCQPDTAVLPSDNLKPPKPAGEISRSVKYAILPILAAMGGFIVPLFIFTMLGSKKALPEYSLIFLSLLFLGILQPSLDLISRKLLIRKTVFDATLVVNKQFSRVLRNSYSYFLRRKDGEIAARFNSWSRAKMTDPVIQNDIIVSTTIILIAVSIMLIISPLLTLLSLATLVFYGLCSAWFQFRKERTTMMIEKTFTEQNSFFLESIRAIATLKTAGLITQRSLQYSSILKNYHAAIRQGSQHEVSERTIYTLIGNVELVVFIALAYPMLTSGSLSFGLFYAFAFIRQILLSYSTTCFMALLKRKENLVAHIRADDVIHYQKQVNHPIQRDFVSPCQIDGLCWHYDSAKTLLKNVTLTITPGDKIAIIGPSGFGKSTFLKILSGLLPAEQGELKQLGQEPATLAWSYLAERCYLSVAEGMLFNGTLKQNITLFNDEIPNEVCLRLLDQLQLTEMLAELPHGLNTMITNSESFLSTGQKQRIMLARALLQEKPIILLDEPTSNLDADTEQVIFELLLSCKKTVIAVTHETDQLAGFGRIYQLVAGGLMSIEHQMSLKVNAG